LARDLIALSGLREGDDIEIQFTGVRPGEKLFEELSLAEEGAEKTRHPKVFVGRIKPHAWETVTSFIAELERAAAHPDGQGLGAVLGHYVPEYHAAELPPLAQVEKQPAPRTDVPAKSTPALAA